MRHPVIAAVSHDDEARDAVALAVAVARAQHAPLVLAGVYVNVLGPGSKGYADALRPATQDDLDAAAADVPADLDHDTRVVGSTSVVRGLHELAEELDAGVLVLGPTHTGRLRRHAPGDVTLGALHAAPCPVAVAPPGFAARSGEGLRTIGVAFDDTPEARSALEAAADVARNAGATVRLLHVLPEVEQPSPYIDEDGAHSDLMDRRERAEALLEEARAGIAQRVPAEAAVLDGDPADVLAAEAERLDLLVLGSRGFGPLRRVLLGSVSAGVVHRAACPVLVLPRGSFLFAAPPAGVPR